MGCGWCLGSTSNWELLLRLRAGSGMPRRGQSCHSGFKSLSSAPMLWEPHLGLHLGCVTRPHQAVRGGPQWARRAHGAPASGAAGSGCSLVYSRPRVFLGRRLPAVVSRIKAPEQGHPPAPRPAAHTRHLQQSRFAEGIKDRGEGRLSRAQNLREAEDAALPALRRGGAVAQGTRASLEAAEARTWVLAWMPQKEVVLH